MNTFKYKSEHNLEQRKEESNRILKEYNNRIPIICESAPNSKLPSLKKVKYLVPSDMTISQFQFIIRRNLDLEEESALFLLTSKNNKNHSVAVDKTILEIYNIYKDKEDNFLYLHYASELTWG